MKETLISPVAALISPQDRIYWVYLFSSILIAVALHILEKRSRFSPKDFFRYCFPAKVVFNRSAVLDYIYYPVNRILFGLLYAPAISVIYPAASGLTKAQLHTLLGGISENLSHIQHWELAYTLANVVAIDLALFIAHFLQHRSAFLWQFHKIHHSAEALTPLTVYRMHPVDDLLALGMSSMFAGITNGIFVHLAGHEIAITTVLHINVITFLFYLLGYNLRHSHIWVTYGQAISHIFISPAQHQIHHSFEARHIDKNYGFLFAFWDWVCGSLYIPQNREVLKLGLTRNEHEKYSSVWRLYFLPLRWGMKNRRFTTLTLAALLSFSATYSVGMTLIDPGPDEVFLERLTSAEVHKKLERGYQSVIIPTGGVEQNGPHLPLGKHNFVVNYTAEQVARQVGKTLVAPVISYVPEGSYDPPEGHMRFAGTISLPPAVFEEILEHAARSLKAHGFKLICFLGDSGGNQESQKIIAAKLNKEWGKEGVRVLHVASYYSANGQMEWLMSNKETAETIGTHAGIRDTSEMLFVKPDTVRQEYVKEATPRSGPDVSGDYTKATSETGKKMLELKVNAAVREIKAYLNNEQSYAF